MKPDHFAYAFIEQGWKHIDLGATQMLAYETAYLSIVLTDLSGTTVPLSDNDWSIRYTQKETGQAGLFSWCERYRHISAQGSIAFLPSYDLQCARCGSGDVRADAIAEWNPEKATWELGSTYDHRICLACESEGSNIVIAVVHGANIHTDDHNG